MQQATHPRIHVRDARDAHTVFEAVRLNYLRPVVRRLNEMERATYVRSGALFVWIECDDDAGLKRWTDGRVWGQSRMREPYLFYDEKLPYDHTGLGGSEANRAPAFRFVDGVSRAGPSSSALSHQERSTNHHKGLVKQAYSAWVMPNPYARPQKWHLTAYFTYADLPHLPTIDHDELLSRIEVPEGIYRSGKTRSREDDDLSGPRSSPSLSSSPSPPTSALLPGSRSLPPLQAAIGPHGTLLTQPRVQVGRLPEDQRVIQMLNSKHIR
ncbi:hypothetical protein D9611_004872 [Ephemerocybe angulata]|uniref:Gti1/Pac2 family-domain-containing protein n=1 Tax=Ephemerocybe angulata TaxID=980116 RepID=A0A8H5EXE0_9AGAR|nr:hypothetical protein D9611_004872 [Tulosesus angulatus]